MEYWQLNTARRGRLSRRSLLGSAGLALGGAALAACGGSNNNANNKSATAAAPSSTRAPSVATAVAGGTAAAPRAGTPQAAGTASALVPGVGPTPNPNAKKGGHFGAIVSNEPNFNVVDGFNEGLYLSGAHVYDRLITARTDSRQYVLEAAASLEQPDDTTITFKLKPNLVYQNLPPVNGRAVKVDDIVATQKYVTNRSSAFDPTFEKSFLDHIETPDPSTVIYKLKGPDGYTFSSSQLGQANSQVIVPAELLDNLDTNKPVGSGPYQLSDDQINTKAVYKRFDQYRDAAKGLPFIDDRTWIVSVDPVAQEAAFRSEQIHVWSAPAGQVDKLSQELGSKVAVDRVSSTNPWGFYLNMNRGLPWQKDPRIRQAIYYATNRDQFVKLVFGGKAVVPPGPMPAGVVGYQLDPKDTAKYWPNDLQGAKQLLAAAGWDSSKQWEVIVSNTSATSTQGGEVWQTQLAQIGFNVTVNGIINQEILQRTGTNNYDIFFAAGPGDNSPARAMRYLHSDQQSSMANMGLHDKDLDALIEKAERTTDYNARVALVKQAQVYALDHWSSVAMLVTPDIISLRNTKLQDYELDGGGVILYRTNMWFNA